MTARHDIPYIGLIIDVLSNGHQKTDRTGTGTISVFGRQMRFDLSDGTIPLLTTKKMHVRSIIHELLWYIEGNTSSTELERNGVTIWQEWKDSKGELGPIYGHLWRSWAVQEVVSVTSREVVSDPPLALPILPLQQPHHDPDTLVGKIFPTRECGDVQVLYRDPSTSNEPHYTVQFQHTGWIKHNVRRTIIYRGHILDVYSPRVCGIGFLGEYDNKDPNVKLLQRHWYKMLERCYDKSTIHYDLYGGSGITVCARWHNFANFQKDVKHIPNWNNKRQNWHLYELDKDYYSASIYSRHTCVWLKRSENTLYRSNPIPFTAVCDGNTYTDLNVRTFCNQHGLTPGLVYRCLAGKSASHKGYTFSYINPTIGHQYRYRLPIDQIEQVINTLKSNPDSRRMIVTAWDPGQLNNAALPPCHYAFQFYTTLNADGTRALSCLLNQRSCDVGLGVPFNIVQYSILTRMIAEVVGMTPGEFIWSGGDVHIYKNHVDALREQVSRDPFDSPTLSFSRRVTDIDDFRYDDFVISNYESHPTLRMEVSV